MLALKISISGNLSFSQKSKLHSIKKRAPTAKNNLTQTDRVQLLQQHNSLRQTVSPSSSDMAQMVCIGMPQYQVAFVLLDQN